MTIERKLGEQMMDGKENDKYCMNLCKTQRTLALKLDKLNALIVCMRYVNYV